MAALPLHRKEGPIDADLLRIPVGPGSIHVERYGHGGAPVVLLHGFGTSSFVWRDIAPEIALANRTAFAIDLFGFGESDRPFDADFGIAAQAELVDRALTALRLPRATVVGLDLGGAVALRMAASRPERVERLVLINPIALDEIPAGDITTLQRSTARFVFRASRGILGAAPILGEVLRRSVSDESRMPDKLVARYLAPYVGEEGLNHLLLLARSVDDEDMEDAELGALTQPTMIIWGDQDPWVSPKFADRLADTIPGSRLVRLPGVGRLVPEEAPDTVVSLLLEFIGAAMGVGG
ncbi:MAG: alpha/beta hydrolase [Gemmatimonadaceae bacterium]|nr:alpha/beta hydrolase [Gemmatimonadaceae bacterium]